MRNPYRLTRPCTLCPFRSDVMPYLTREHVEEIDSAILREEFYCHETTGAKGGPERRRDEFAHCAGALIVLEKMRRPSQMMRIAERLGLYDRTRLDMSAPTYDSMVAMAAAQEET